jgi:alkylhydroperoxidase family enzyme
VYALTASAFRSSLQHGGTTSIASRLDLCYERTHRAQEASVTTRHRDGADTIVKRGSSPPTPYASQVSIPLPSDADVKKVMGDAFNPNETLNVLKMFAGAEDMYQATIGLVKAVFETKGIDPKTREMIILRAAKVMNCPYEWQANLKFAANAGLSPDEIKATESDGSVAGINPEYVLICQATDELCTDATLRDGTLRQLLDRYGDVISRKLVLMIAWFNLLSRFLNGCRVPLETTNKIAAGQTSPLR